MEQGKIAERVRRWKTATPPQYGEHSKRGDEPPCHWRQEAGAELPKLWPYIHEASSTGLTRPFAQSAGLLQGRRSRKLARSTGLPARWKSLQDKALAGDESYMGVSNRGLQAPLARNLLHLAKFVPLAAAFNISARPGKRAEEPSPLGEIYPLATAFGNPTWLGKRAEKSSSPGQSLSPCDCI